MEGNLKWVNANDVYPLRLMVLRPEGKNQDCIWPGDDDADHLGVHLDGEVVCIASFYRRNFENETEAIQLRGMATHPDHRGKGFGKALVEYAMQYYRKHGARIMWCNARVVALDFYRKLGYEIVGEPFEVEGIGTHFRMVFRLDL